MYFLNPIFCFLITLHIIYSCASVDPKFGYNDLNLGEKLVKECKELIEEAEELDEYFYRKNKENYFANTFDESELGEQKKYDQIYAFYLTARWNLLFLDECTDPHWILEDMEYKHHTVLGRAKKAGILDENGALVHKGEFPAFANETMRGMIGRLANMTEKHVQIYGQIEQKVNEHQSKRAMAKMDGTEKDSTPSPKQTESKGRKSKAKSRGKKQPKKGNLDLADKN